MARAIVAALLIAIGLSTSAVAQSARKISTCFEEFIAALRLTDLDEGIALCDRIVEDRAAPPSRRGQALAQRGLMYARKWSIMSSGPTFAPQAISDITEALQLDSPPSARRNHLLVIRAQLYVATGQRNRAVADYREVLKDDPANVTARDGLAWLGPQEGL